MSLTTGSLRLVRLITGLLLLVGVPLLLYWTLFMSRRLDDWQRTNVALLGTLARALEARIEQERGIAADKTQRATEYLSSLSRGELVAADRQSAAKPKQVKLDLENRKAFVEFARGEGVWRVPFAKMFPAFGLDTGFDAVLVVDREGRVLHQEPQRQQESGSVRLAPGSSLRLARGDGRPMDFAELLGGKPPPPEQGDAHSAKASDAVSLRDLLLGIADVPRARLDGAELLVYPRAVQIPDAETEIAVLGMVETSRLIRHAVRLSPIALTWIFALVMAVFLAIPYFKIRYLGRHEPLRAIDMWQLALFALLGTGIASLLTLQIGALARLRAPMDDALQDFARDVSAQVHDEIQAAWAQLQASAPALAASPPGARGRILVSDETFEHYPYFEALILTDSVRQLRKWMPNTVPTPMIEVANGVWFKGANALRAGDAPFVFESIVAKNSARELAVIATPGRLAPGAVELGPQVPLEERTGVAAIATPMLSLHEPITPFGFEFVVIDGKDHVAFRSGESRNARESFYDDIDGGEQLRALVESARRQNIEKPPAPVDFRYRGSMHRGTVIPFPDPSLTLVAYYDKELIESPAGHVFLIGLVWLAVLTLLCFAAAAATRWVHPRATDIAWPTERFHSVYLLGCLVFSGVAALLVALSWALPRWWSPYALLGIPVATIITLPLLPLDWIASRVRALESRFPWAGALRRVYPYSYVLAGAIALIALIAVPVAIVHFDSFDAHRAALALGVQRKQGEMIAARTKERSRLWVATEEPKCTRAKNEGCRIVAVKASDRERLLNPPFGLYESALTESLFSDATRASSQPAPDCGTLFGFDGERLPRNYFSNALAPCLRWLASGGSVPESALVDADASGVVFVSRSPGVLPLASRTVLAGLALALVLGFFVHSVSQRILGLELEGDGVVDRSGEVGGFQRALLLRPPPSRVAALADTIKAQTGQSFDLADPTLSLDTVIGVRSEIPLLLTGLETRLGDAADRAKLLEILEKPRKDGRLLLVSAIDPLYFVGARLWETSSQGAPAGAEAQSALDREAELGRWARALDGVERIRFDLPSSTPGSPVVTVRKGLLTRLRKECEWDDRLLEVERSLILRADLDRFNWERMVDYVQDAAEPHYRFLWSLCSMEERRVLRQLGAEGFVNPHFFDVLRRLRRRRLVRVDPRIRVASESLRRFIRDERPTASELAWEQKLPKADTSRRIRGPLLVFGALAAAILALTQAEFLNSALATATAIAGTLTVVASLATQTRQIGGTS